MEEMRASQPAEIEAQRERGRSPLCHPASPGTPQPGSATSSILFEVRLGLIAWQIVPQGPAQ